MAKNTPNSNSIAIELGTAAVRVLEAERGGAGEGQVLRRGSASLPAAFWQDPAAQSAALSNAIRDALLSAGITGKTVVLSIPRWLVTLRFVRLPQAEPEQLRGMIQFEAQQYILFPLEEVVFDYCPVNDFMGGDDLQLVLLAAARRPVIQAIMGACEHNGLEVAQITVSSLALAEHLRAAAETTALIHVETGVAEVAVASNRQMIFSRSSQLDVGRPPDLANQRLREEIAKTFLAYQNEFANRPIESVLISGEGLNQGVSLEALLHEVIDIPVRHVRARLLPPNEVGNYAIAAGTALQALPSAKERLNLLPTEGAERKAEAARKRNNALAVAVAAVVVIGAAWGVNSQLKAQEKGAKELKAKMAELDDAKSAEEVRKRAYDSVKSIVDDLEKGLGRKHPIVDVMVVISKALPSSEQAWLTQMSFERGGTLTLRGESKLESAATDMVLALQKTGAFLEVRLGYMGDAQGANARNAALNAAQKPQNPMAGGVAPLPDMNPKPGGAAGIPPPQPNPQPANQPPPQPMPQPRPAPPNMPPNLSPGMNPLPSPFPGGRPPALPAGPGLGTIQIQGGTGEILNNAVISSPVLTDTVIESKGPNPGTLPYPQIEDTARRRGQEDAARAAEAKAEAIKREAVLKQAPPHGGAVMIQGGTLSVGGKVQAAPLPNNHRAPILITPKDMKSVQTAPAVKVAASSKTVPPAVQKPSVIATKPAPTQTPEVVASGGKMSFVITCKLNPNAQDIAAAIMAEADKKEVEKKTAGKKEAKKSEH